MAACTALAERLRADVATSSVGRQRPATMMQATTMQATMM